MPYIGRDLNRGNYLKLDDISSSFNGSTQTFNLTVGGSAFTPGSAFSILVSVGGVIQEPESAYQVNNSQITFANAPTAQDGFFCTALAVPIGIGVPGNGTVNGTQVAKPFNYDGYFYLDDANNRVGIGSLQPKQALDIIGNTNISGILTASTFNGSIVGNTNNASGISTFYDLRVSNNLTVEGSTTTLDTNLVGVDRVEVGANSNTVVGVAITQSGTADILRLYDGTSQVVTVDDEGRVGIGSAIPAAKLDVSPSIQVKNTALNGGANVDINAANGGQSRLNLYAGVSGGVNRASRIDFHNQGVAQWMLINDFAQNGTNDFSIRHGSEYAISCVPDGTVSLYDDGDESLRTDATGILVPEKVIHLGDTDTFLQFTPNTINLHSGGTTGLTVLDASVRVPTKLGINGAAPQTPLDVIANGSGYAMAIRGRSSDNLAELRFTSNDYGSLYGQIATGPTYLNLKTGGVERLQLDATETTFNSTGADTDFRVRTPAQTHMFYVNAGNDQVSIKTSNAQSGAVLTVNGRTHIDTQLTLGSNSTLDAGAQATIYKPDTNMLAFATAGANERLRITNTGNVGIKSTAPRGRLDIQFDGAPSFITFGADADNPKMEWFRSTGGSPSHYGIELQQVLGDLVLSTAAAANLGSHSYVEKVRITSAGRVGIGTDTMTAKLEISDAIGTTGEEVLLKLQGRATKNVYLDINADANRRGVIRFKSAGTDKWSIGRGDSDELSDSSFFIATGNSGGNTTKLAITSDGFIGINDTTPYNGLTINKEGDYWDTNGNTYAHPVGRVLSSWRGDRNDNTDYWVGFVGQYNKPSATVNILLQPHVGNFGNQAGMYIAGEATGAFSSDFTLGKIVGGSQAGQGTSGNQRATKSELFRINSSGKVIVGNDGTTFGNAAVQAFIQHGNTAGESGFSSVDTTSVAAGVGGEIAFHGKYNTGAQDYAYLGHIRGIKENATAGNTACALTFHTRPNATAPQERLRIASNGDVIWYGIGTQTPGHSNNTVGLGFEPRNGAIFTSRSDNFTIASNRGNDGAHFKFAQTGTDKFHIGLFDSGATFRISSGGASGGTSRFEIDATGHTRATVRARTLVTSYEDAITNLGGCLTGGDNSRDCWIFNWYDSAVWGIYSRNIDSTLTVNGFGLPQNSTAFIGNSKLRAYISHESGEICGSGGFLIDGESTTTNQAKGIRWTAYDKEGTTDRSDVAGIIHTINQEGILGAVLRIYSDNDDNDGVVIKGGNTTGAYGTRIVNGLWMRSGGLRPTFGTGDNGITWANDPAGGSGDIANIQWYADGSGENTRLRILVGNDADDDIRLEATNVTVQGTFSATSNKGFRIPHVLTGLTTTTDLVHTAVEGPQADLIYRGRAKLVAGISTVNIDTTNNMTDGTFVNLNRDVQCFTSNETGWTAVKGSVTGNLLTIIAQDNTCTDTISWMVVGERWDLAMYDPINPMTAENGKLKTEIPNSSYNKGGDYEQDYIRENKLRVGISTMSRPSIENKEVE